MTRLIKLSHFGDKGRTFFAKVEGDNVTGSMKDRMVEYVLHRLESEGTLKKGMVIVEASSGNTGTALAKVGVEMGYDVFICMPTHVSKRKKEMIQHYGGKTLEFDTSIDSEADIRRAREMGAQSGFYFFNQFENPYHVPGYYDTLGVEVVQQLRARDVTIDTLIGGIGTGGSLLGLGTRLRQEHNPAMRIYAVGAQQSPSKIDGLLPWRQRGFFKIWSDRPKHFEDGSFLIDDEDAIQHAIFLQDYENISVGPSSGAVLAVALHKISDQGNCLLFFADDGKKYAELFEQRKKSLLQPPT